MSQTNYRCVECSQPMTQPGVLCPACQKRTGRLETPAEAAKEPKADPLYATASAPPLYTAPTPAQPIDLSAPASPPIYSPPSLSTPVAGRSDAPVSGGMASGSSAYPPPPVGKATPKSNPAAEDALRRADAELAMLRLQNSTGTSYGNSSWAERFLMRLGTRLLIRFAIVGIIGVVAAVSGVRHHQEQTDYTSSAESQTQTSGLVRRAPQQPGGGFGAANMLPPTVVNVQGSRSPAVTERQLLDRVNAAYEDAKRALNGAENGNPGDRPRLLAQVDSDIQIMREGMTRLSSPAAQQVGQAITELESRTQSLNQSQMPLMPPQNGTVTPQESAGIGSSAPTDNGRQGQPVGGQGQQAGGQAPEPPGAGDGTPTGSGQPVNPSGQNTSPGGSGGI